MAIRFASALLLFFASGLCFNQSIQKRMTSARRWAIPVGIAMIVLEIILLTSHD